MSPDPVDAAVLPFLEPPAFQGDDPIVSFLLAQLRDLRDQLHQRASPLPRMVVLSAPTGAGKTRLVQEFYARAVEEFEQGEGLHPPTLRSNLEPADRSNPVAAAERARKLVAPEPDALRDGRAEFIWLGAHGRSVAGSRPDPFGDEVPTQVDVYLWLLQVEHDRWLRFLKDEVVDLAETALDVGVSTALLVPKAIRRFLDIRRESAFGATPRTFGATVERLDALMGIRTARDLQGSRVARPLVLVLDDAHDLPGRSVDRLAALLDSSTGTPRPVLVVVTTHPERLNSSGTTVARFIEEAHGHLEGASGTSRLTVFDDFAEPTRSRFEAVMREKFPPLPGPGSAEQRDRIIHDLAERWTRSRSRSLTVAVRLAAEASDHLAVEAGREVDWRHWLDGREVASDPDLERIYLELPPQARALLLDLVGHRAPVLRSWIHAGAGDSLAALIDRGIVSEAPLAGPDGAATEPAVLWVTSSHGAHLAARHREEVEDHRRGIICDDDRLRPAELESLFRAALEPDGTDAVSELARHLRARPPEPTDPPSGGTAVGALLRDVATASGEDEEWWSVLVDRVVASAGDRPHLALAHAADLTQRLLGRQLGDQVVRLAEAVLPTIDELALGSRDARRVVRGYVEARRIANGREDIGSVIPLAMRASLLAALRLHASSDIVLAEAYLRAVALGLDGVAPEDAERIVAVARALARSSFAHARALLARVESVGRERLGDVRDVLHAAIRDHVVRGRDVDAAALVLDRGGLPSVAGDEDGGAGHDLVDVARDVVVERLEQLPGGSDRPRIPSGLVFGLGSLLRDARPGAGVLATVGGDRSAEIILRAAEADPDIAARVLAVASPGVERRRAWSALVELARAGASGDPIRSAVALLKSATDDEERRDAAAVTSGLAAADRGLAERLLSWCARTWPEGQAEAHDVLERHATDDPGLLPRLLRFAPDSERRAIAERRLIDAVEDPVVAIEAARHPAAIDQLDRIRATLRADILTAGIDAPRSLLAMIRIAGDAADRDAALDGLLELVRRMGSGENDDRINRFREALKWEADTQLILHLLSRTGATRFARFLQMKARRYDDVVAASRLGDLAFARPMIWRSFERDVRELLLRFSDRPRAVRALARLSVAGVDRAEALRLVLAAREEHPDDVDVAIGLLDLARSDSGLRDEALSVLRSSDEVAALVALAAHDPGADGLRDRLAEHAPLVPAAAIALGTLGDPRANGPIALHAAWSVDAASLRRPTGDAASPLEAAATVLRTGSGHRPGAAPSSPLVFLARLTVDGKTTRPVHASVEVRNRLVDLLLAIDGTGSWGLTYLDTLPARRPRIATWLGESLRARLASDLRAPSLLFRLLAAGGPHREGDRRGRHPAELLATTAGLADWHVPTAVALSSPPIRAVIPAVDLVIAESVPTATPEVLEQYASVIARLGRPDLLRIALERLAAAIGPDGGPMSRDRAVALAHLLAAGPDGHEPTDRQPDAGLRDPVLNRLLDLGRLDVAVGAAAAALQARLGPKALEWLEQSVRAELQQRGRIGSNAILQALLQILRGSADDALARDVIDLAHDVVDHQLDAAVAVEADRRFGDELRARARTRIAETAVRAHSPQAFLALIRIHERGDGDLEVDGTAGPRPVARCLVEEVGPVLRELAAGSSHGRVLAARLDRAVGGDDSLAILHDHMGGEVTAAAWALVLAQDRMSFSAAAVAYRAHELVDADAARDALVLAGCAAERVAAIHEPESLADRELRRALMVPSDVRAIDLPGPPRPSEHRRAEGDVRLVEAARAGDLEAVRALREALPRIRREARQTRAGLRLLADVADLVGWSRSAVRIALAWEDDEALLRAAQGAPSGPGRDDLLRRLRDRLGPVAERSAEHAAALARIAHAVGAAEAGRRPLEEPDSAAVPQVVLRRDLVAIERVAPFVVEPLLSELRQWVMDAVEDDVRRFVVLLRLARSDRQVIAVRELLRDRPPAAQEQILAGILDAGVEPRRVSLLVPAEDPMREAMLEAASPWNGRGRPGWPSRALIAMELQPRMIGRSKLLRQLFEHGQNAAVVAAAWEAARAQSERRRRRVTGPIVAAFTAALRRLEDGGDPAASIHLAGLCVEDYLPWSEVEDRIGTGALGGPVATVLQGLEAVYTDGGVLRLGQDELGHAQVLLLLGAVSPRSTRNGRRFSHLVAGLRGAWCDLDSAVRARVVRAAPELVERNVLAPLRQRDPMALDEPFEALSAQPEQAGALLVAEEEVEGPLRERLVRELSELAREHLAPAIVLPAFAPTGQGMRDARALLEPYVAHSPALVASELIKHRRVCINLADLLEEPGDPLLQPVIDAAFAQDPMPPGAVIALAGISRRLRPRLRPLLRRRLRGTDGTLGASATEVAHALEQVVDGPFDRYQAWLAVWGALRDRPFDQQRKLALKAAMLCPVDAPTETVLRLDERLAAIAAGDEYVVEADAGRRHLRRAFPGAPLPDPGPAGAAPGPTGQGPSAAQPVAATLAPLVEAVEAGGAGPTPTDGAEWSAGDRERLLARLRRAPRFGLMNAIMAAGVPGRSLVRLFGAGDRLLWEFVEHAASRGRFEPEAARLITDLAAEVAPLRRGWAAAARRATGCDHPMADDATAADHPIVLRVASSEGEERREAWREALRLRRADPAVGWALAALDLDAAERSELVAALESRPAHDAAAVVLVCRLLASADGPAVAAAHRRLAAGLRHAPEQFLSVAMLVDGDAGWLAALAERAGEVRRALRSAVRTLEPVVGSGPIPSPILAAVGYPWPPTSPLEGLRLRRRLLPELVAGTARQTLERSLIEHRASAAEIARILPPGSTERRLALEALRGDPSVGRLGAADACVAARLGRDVLGFGTGHSVHLPEIVEKVQHHLDDEQVLVEAMSMPWGRAGGAARLDVFAVLAAVRWHVLLGSTAVALAFHDRVSRDPVALFGIPDHLVGLVMTPTRDLLLTAEDPVAMAAARPDPGGRERLAEALASGRGDVAEALLDHGWDPLVPTHLDSFLSTPRALVALDDLFSAGSVPAEAEVDASRVRSALGRFALEDPDCALRYAVRLGQGGIEVLTDVARGATWDLETRLAAAVRALTKRSRNGGGDASAALDAGIRVLVGDEQLGVVDVALVLAETLAARRSEGTESPLVDHIRSVLLAPAGEDAFIARMLLPLVDAEVRVSLLERHASDPLLQSVLLAEQGVGAGHEALDPLLGRITTLMEVTPAPGPDRDGPPVTSARSPLVMAMVHEALGVQSDGARLAGTVGRSPLAAATDSTLIWETGRASGSGAVVALQWLKARQASIPRHLVARLLGDGPGRSSRLLDEVLGAGLLAEADVVRAGLRDPMPPRPWQAVHVGALVEGDEIMGHPVLADEAAELRPFRLEIADIEAVVPRIALPSGCSGEDPVLLRLVLLDGARGDVWAIVADGSDHRRRRGQQLDAADDAPMTTGVCVRHFSLAQQGGTVNVARVWCPELRVIGHVPDPGRRFSIGATLAVRPIARGDGSDGFDRGRLGPELEVVEAH